MAYLPGVPDVGPAPVSPTVKSSGSASIGKPQGIAAVAHTVGKPGNTQHLGSIVGRRGAGMTAVGGGDQALHSMGHYGKTAPPMLGGGASGGVQPTAHAGAKMIRGTQMSGHIRQGGLGPGKVSAPGTSDNYSMNSMDTE